MGGLQQEVWSKTGQLKAGNELYQVEFEQLQWARVSQQLSLWQDGLEAGDDDVFGITHLFSLVTAVDRCREPLVHFGTFRRMAQQHGLALDTGPVPLADVVSEALSDSSGKAELGRLRRIYAFQGGMSCSETSREWSALQLYSAFAFRKEATLGEESMDCARLSSCLERLHSDEGHARRMPRDRRDIAF